MKLKIFVLSICLLLNLTHADDKGYLVAKKSQEANNGFIGERNFMEMHLINANNDKIIRKMNSKIQEKQNEGDRSIISFEWPLDVKGVKMLTWSHKEDDDDQWLYLPSIKRIKRISSSNKSGSFMGSEFSYEDFSSQEIEKYNYRYIKDEEFNKRKTEVIERTTKDQNSGYTKQIIWMDKEYLNPIKIDYYDRKSELLKTAHFLKYKKIKKWWRAMEMEMINHQTKKRSIIIWNKRDLEVTFQEQEFNKDNLVK